MADENRSMKEVVDLCLACEFKGSDRCDCCDNRPVTQCIPFIVPTDEELASLAGATEEVLLRLKEKVRKSANGWKGPTDEDEEFALAIKTGRDAFDKLKSIAKQYRTQHNSEKEPHQDIQSQSKPE